MKIIGIIVCMLLIGTVLPVSGTISVEKIPVVTLKERKTLYVGGSGPNNYTYIQDAINDASDGDTVFVYDDSSPYKESFLNIEKPINLIGEDKNTTVIDGGNDYTIITIYSLTLSYTDGVNISGFTIRNSSSSFYACGIKVMSNYNNISGNIFEDNKFASIYIAACDYNYIVDNIFTGYVVDDLFCINEGIWLELASFTTIMGNIFINCFSGIAIISSINPPLYSKSNIISGNLFDGNGAAMEIRADNTLIYRNTISNHNRPSNLIAPALALAGRNNTVSCNNFISNIRDANDVFYILSLRDMFKIRKYGNVWDGNYWGKPRFLPKIIFGYLRFERKPPNSAIPFLFFDIDLHPAKEPYTIGV